MADFDAIAVGGALAGAAFALEMARSGARVAVIERTSAATLKVCGDFLSCEAQALLAHLGLDLTHLGAVPIGTLRLATGERRAAAPLPFAAAGLSRLCLDEALLAAAQSAGAEIVRGETVTALEPDTDGSVRVRLGARTLTADCAALATGKHNLRGWPRAPASVTAYKIQFGPTPAAARSLKDIVQLVGYRGGYIGACEVENGAVTICWLIDAAAMREIGADWTAQLAHISRGSSALGDLLNGARYLSARPAAISGIPFGYRRRAAIAPNVYAIGDQLCVIPSFTGDGTSLALSSGAGAAHARLAGQTAGEFQKAFLDHVRTQFFCAGAVDTLFKSAALRALSVQAIAAMPVLAQIATSLTRVKDYANPAARGATTRAR
jgi:menaquinone-9 beta-reductase